MTVKKLIWDGWNIEHIARHNVTKDEVEELCTYQPIVEKGYGGRIRLIGPTNSGRMLGIVLAPKSDKIYYVVTARPASRKERKAYEQKNTKI
ncbi:hypothetical protein A2803_00845 [Candidatus Woesebacteria bacterium RIFCSPHIGHO2_01_FULL_44_21]|uniref:BrnT family toxin n=1 Tax=Candidatus Woesebacteria bacterium RIFCSPHIGHO2_01_FULL_44_21 TaxID=1802503 RepID=A0A1F7YXV3_9BACT|nr:MAG: hypothetical protein A2803_00845 [Candidatus Woesebacteria bacterium RIFCSPHIGHO2_01_FULL_44_21]OGM70049.1 MAG: hypothetical protein A2897_00030 [Candidatus Woesebacteria bacterium RIFCSPLOWO2_01_FULL_44_24b]